MDRDMYCLQDYPYTTTIGIEKYVCIDSELDLNYLIQMFTGFVRSYNVIGC